MGVDSRYSSDFYNLAAYALVQVTNMEKQLSFIHGNFNDPLPFADDSFDALYQVQVLTYTIDPVKLSKVGECECVCVCVINK